MASSPPASPVGSGAAQPRLPTQARSSPTPVVVVGAGLTGLATAFHLRQRGVEARLFERSAEPGGLATTIEERGYRFDRTGHLLHTADEATRTLALEWIGPEHQEIIRRSAIFTHRGYVRYPFQANLHGLPPQVAYDCLLGFIEAERAGQHASDAARKIGTFEQFSLATFGRGISEHFMLPYNSRMWGVAPSEITAEWCSRFVPVPTLQDVVAGAVGLADRELGYNARFVHPKRGIGALAEGLAKASGPIELGRTMQQVRTESRELWVDDEVVPYQVLVSTAPLPQLIECCDDVPAPVRAAARQLRCTHLYYLDVALRSRCALPYHWVYVPEARYPFYRVGSYSNVSPEMTPPGKGSLYVELVDRAEPDLDRLLPEVADGLVEMGYIDRAEAIVFARLRRIDHAYVLFDHSYYAALETIMPFLRAHRIISCGRYGGWNYSSMSDALRFGHGAATEATALLADETSGEPT